MRKPRLREAVCFSQGHTAGFDLDLDYISPLDRFPPEQVSQEALSILIIIAANIY